MVHIFIDGRVSATLMSEDIAIIDGPFAAGQQICLFGSKNVAETLGANIKNLWFDARAYSQADAQGLYDNLQYEGSWECDVSASPPSPSFTPSLSLSLSLSLSTSKPNTNMPKTPTGMHLQKPSGHPRMPSMRQVQYPHCGLYGVDLQGVHLQQSLWRGMLYLRHTQELLRRGCCSRMISRLSYGCPQN